MQQKDAVTQDDGNYTASLSGNSPVSGVLNSFVSPTTLSTISSVLIPNSFVSTTVLRVHHFVSL